MRNHLSLYIFHVKNTDQNNYPLLQAFRVLIQKICRPTNVFQQAPDISISDFSVITQVIIEILALSLAENVVIFRFNHLRRGDYSGRTNFQNSRLALCQCI